MRDAPERDGVRPAGLRAGPPGGEAPKLALRSGRYKPTTRETIPVSADPLRALRAAPDPRDPRAPALLTPWRGEEDARGRVVLLGLPYDGGIPSRPGARFGPRALREAFAAFGTWDGERDLAPILDAGDLHLPTTDGAVAHARVEEASRALFAAGAVPVFLGGDHGLTGSTIRGLAAARPDARLAVVNVDAHLDVREYEDERSLSSGTPFRRALETGIVPRGGMAVLGLRRFANSRFYLDYADAQGVRRASVEELAAEGAARVAETVVTAALADADALYLSVDLDAADVAHAPGVSAQGTGGLTSREMIDVVRATLDAAGSRLVGADVMELSPPLDPDGRTARLAARVLLEIVASVQARGER